MDEPHWGTGAVRTEKSGGQEVNCRGRNQHTWTPIAHHLTEGTEREGKWEPAVKTKGAEVRKREERCLTEGEPEER